MSAGQVEIGSAWGRDMSDQTFLELVFSALTIFRSRSMLHGAHIVDQAAMANSRSQII